VAIDAHLGRKIIYINNKHKNTYVELDDSNKIAYDTILIATGTDPVHPPIKGLEN
jgi:NAD(P)H-nitrite reductase large subunit